MSEPKTEATAEELTEEGEINWRYQVLDAMKNADTYFAEKSAEAVLDNLLQAHTAQRLSELKVKADINQGEKDLRGLADECRRIGEILKTSNLEVAEDIWHMEDTLHGIANKLEKALQLIEEVRDE